VVELGAGRDGPRAITVTADESGVRVTLIGEIDMTDRPALDGALQDVLSRPPAAVTVDLTLLTFLGSSGMEFLARLYDSIHAEGHTVTLLNPSAMVLRSLDTTGMLDWFIVEEQR